MTRLLRILIAIFCLLLFAVEAYRIRPRGADIDGGWSVESRGEKRMISPVAGSIDLPPSPAGRSKYSVAGIYLHRFWQPTRFRIIADDCLLELSVNGKSIDLRPYSETICEFNHGTAIDLGSAIQNGQNEIRAVVSNASGAGAWTFRHERRSFPGPISVGAFSLGLFLLFFAPPKGKARAGTAVSRGFRRFLAGPFAPWALLGVSLLTYGQNLSRPNGFFWDENYHVASAQKYLHRVHFLEPHPPLGKLFIALGEWVLDADAADGGLVATDYGSSPAPTSFLGYRLFPAAFAIGCVLLFAWVIARLTRRRSWGMIAGFALAFENSTIAHSRGAMLDSTVLFFALLAWALLLRKRMRPRDWVFAGLAFGAACATKYNAAFFAVFFLGRAVADRDWRGPLRAVASALVVFLCVWQIHFALGRRIEMNLPEAGYYHSSEAYRDIARREEIWTPRAFAIRLRDSLAFFAHYTHGVPALDPCKPGENGSGFFAWPLGGKSIRYRWERVAPSANRNLVLAANPAFYAISFLGVLFALAIAIASITQGSAPAAFRDWRIIAIGVFYMAYAAAAIASPRVLYLYHYQFPLLLGLTLFFSVLQSVPALGPIPLDRRKRDRILLFALVSIFSSFLFFSPLTYFSALANDELARRAWLSVWRIE